MLVPIVTWKRFRQQIFISITKCLAGSEYRRP